MTQEQLRNLDRLLETDMPLVSIAAELGISYHTLRIRLADRDEEIRRVRVPRKREAALTIEGRGEGAEHADICHHR